MSPPASDSPPRPPDAVTSSSSSSSTTASRSGGSRSSIGWKRSLPLLSTDLHHHRSRPSTANRDGSSSGSAQPPLIGGIGGGGVGGVSVRAASPSANISPSTSAASPISTFAQAFSMKKRLSDSITDSWSRRRPSLPHGSSTGSVPSTSSRLKDAPSTNTNSYHAASTPATSATSNNTNNNKASSSSSHSSKSRNRSSSATTATTTAQQQAQNYHYSQSRSNTLTSSTSIGTLTSSSSASSISGYIGGGISRQESYTDMSRAFPQPPTPLGGGGGGGATQGWDRRLEGIDSPTVPVYENMVPVRGVSSRPIAGPADLREVDEIIDESVDSYGADEHFTRNQDNAAAASQRAAADVGMRRMSSGLTRKISDSRRILTGPLPVEEPRSPLSQSESVGMGGMGIQSRKIYTNQQTLLGLPPNFNSRDSTVSDTPSTVRGYEASSDDDSTTSSSMMSMAMRSPSQGLPQTMSFSQSSRASSRTQHSSPQGSEYRGLSEKTSMSALEKLSSRPQGAAGNGPSRSMTASPARNGLLSMSSVNLRSLSVTPANGSTARVSSIGQRDTSGSAIAAGGPSLTRASSIALSPTSRSDSNSSTTSTTLETNSPSTKDRSHAANASTVRGKNPTIQPTSALKQITTILPIPDAASAPKVAKAPASGMYWYKAPTHGMTHEPLRAHSCTLLGSNIYVFGGCNTKSSFNDLQVFDADSMSWSQPQVRGELPPPLRAMTTTAVRNKLVIFGGGDGPSYFNDVYVYDTVTGRYTKPPLGSAQQPVRRRAHTACLYKNGIYVFGGGDGVKALNDVWRLDVTDLNKPYWDLISPNSSPRPSKPTSSSRHHISEDEPKPKPRGYHTANMVGSKLIVYGGSDGEECFQDVWVFDLDTALWKQVDIKKSYSRLSHTSTVIGSCLFVVGGHDGVAYSSEVLLLNLVTMQWDRRKVYGKPPGGRGYHCAVLYDSRLFVLGGFDGQEVFGETYILELAVSSYYSQISHFSVIVNPT